VLRYERLNFDDDAAQADVAQGMQKTYSFTINELREYQGKDPLPMGDVILIAGRGAPIAIDPQTGEATILGGPQPGEVTVDESSDVPPVVAAGGATVPAAPTARVRPGTAVPRRLPNAPAVAAKSAAIDYDRLADHIAARMQTKAAVSDATKETFLAAKKVIDEKAEQQHTGALVQAFYEQEQRVKAKLGG
jgi:hypothetical protein